MSNPCKFKQWSNIGRCLSQHLNIVHTIFLTSKKINSLIQLFQEFSLNNINLIALLETFRMIFQRKAL